MEQLPPRVLRFDCPFSRPGGYRTDGFLGVWSPHRTLWVDRDRPDPSRAAILNGSNWLLCSAVASVPSGIRPKIHHDPAGGRGLAFRGYVVEPPLHQFSAPADLWRFWGNGGSGHPNGLFAMALVEGHPPRLTLRTDAFGFAPLYYRVHEDLVLFGTKPDLLATADLELDPLGASTLMAHNYPVGDRTLLRGIHRCPIGASLRFDGTPKPIVDRWLTAADLPAPKRPVDRTAMDHVEAVFTQAVRRCTALDYGSLHLPLSGGHDSRRILGALIRDRTPFASSTVRTYTKGGRDLDARYAAELAARFGFPHASVELPSADEYARDDARRRFELCAETWMHEGWMGSFLRGLPAEPANLIDGFLGDVLGNPGYNLADARYFREPEADIEAVAERAAMNPLGHYLDPRFCPASAVKDEIRQYLAPFAGRRNVAEFAMLLLRQRRATALRLHQMVPPEHLVTCPYTDLDYIRAVVALHPEDRSATPLQGALLRRFHPDLAAVAGSHTAPSDSPASERKGNRDRTGACVRRLTQQTEPARHRRLLRGRLSPLGRALVMAGAASPAAARRWHWALRPILESLLHDRTTTAVWHIDKPTTDAGPVGGNDRSADIPTAAPPRTPEGARP